MAPIPRGPRALICEARTTKHVSGSAPTLTLARDARGRQGDRADLDTVGTHDAATTLAAENARLRERVRALEADRAQADARANRRLARFAQTTDGWFWEMDAHLRFTYFSPSVEAVTGVAPEWHYGKTREDIGIPDSVSQRHDSSSRKAVRWSWVQITLVSRLFPPNSRLTTW